MGKTRDTCRVTFDGRADDFYDVCHLDNRLLVFGGQALTGDDDAPIFVRYSVTDVPTFPARG